MGKQMMRCADRGGCPAKRHEVGSAAHARCRGHVGATARAAGGALQPTPTPTPCDQPWKSGTLHPTGGYDQITTHTHSLAPFPDVRVTTYRRDGAPHRADGPAVIEAEESSGAAISWSWFENGQRHRGDGPASWSRHFDSGAGSLAWRGTMLGPADNLVFRARIEAVLAAGADPATVVGWLAYPNEVTTALATKVTGPDDIAPAWEAGVREIDALAAVASGELPLSWALAGLGR